MSVDKNVEFKFRVGAFYEYIGESCNEFEKGVLYKYDGNGYFFGKDGHAYEFEGEMDENNPAQDYFLYWEPIPHNRTICC